MSNEYPTIVRVNSVHIDWFSFTIGMPDDVTTESDMFAHISMFIEHAIGGENYTKFFHNAQWANIKARPPYHSAVRSQHGVVCMWGTQNHVLVEVQGCGCQQLNDAHALKALMANMSYRATRVDIALDIDKASMGGTLEEFAKDRGDARFKSSAHMMSGSGETHYVGNRQSDRYAKVYEYAEPHDRANEPRLEFTLRKHYARSACQYVAAYGVAEVAQMCQNSFRFRGLPRVSSTMEKMPGKQRDKSNNKRIHWLLKQVAPAVQKLIRDGEIDEYWVAEHFIPDEKRVSFLEKVGK